MEFEFFLGQLKVLDKPINHFNMHPHDGLQDMMIHIPFFSDGYINLCLVVTAGPNV